MTKITFTGTRLRKDGTTAAFRIDNASDNDFNPAAIGQLIDQAAEVLDTVMSPEELVAGSVTLTSPGFSPQSVTLAPKWCRALVRDIDFPNVPANSTVNHSEPFPGLNSSHFVWANMLPAWPDGLLYTVIPDEDEVIFKLTNVTGAPINPASLNVRLMAFRLQI